MITAIDIREFAARSGIHAIGWFAASDFAGYLAALRARPGYHRLAYRSLASFEKAGHIPDGIRTVIVLAMDYYIESGESRDGFRLSNYSRACWNTTSPKTAMLVEFLQSHGCRAARLDVPQRAAACRAGLGFIGRNTMFYAHGLGSFVGIGSVGTDAALEEGATAPEQITHPRCADCGRCAAACPVAAIPAAGYAIEPMRCLSMLNRHPDEPEQIQPQDAVQLERWVYGCESCQNACPLNAGVQHRRQAVVAPELTVEGMRLPNRTTVTAAELRAALPSVKSAGFRAYLERLLASPV
jgi:epoxyqueuosine reductase QueG